MVRYAVNGSILLTGLPLNERPAAIRKAGFAAAEFWWPFVEAAPADSEIDDFARSIEDAGIRLTALNFFAGDMAAGERGVVCQPDRRTEFAANIDALVRIAERLGCRAFNALYGLPGDDQALAEETAIENLSLAAAAVGRLDGVILIEPLSGVPTYPIKTAADALELIMRLRRAGVVNVKLLADFYHLASNGDDVPAVIRDHSDEIGHIQIADVPGRGEPGTGDLPLREWIAQAEEAGYQGWIGLEYQSKSDDPFGWLKGEHR